MWVCVIWMIVLFSWYVFLMYMLCFNIFVMVMFLLNVEVGSVVWNFFFYSV